MLEVCGHRTLGSARARHAVLENEVSDGADPEDPDDANDDVMLVRWRKPATGSPGAADAYQQFAIA